MAGQKDREILDRKRLLDIYTLVSDILTTLHKYFSRYEDTEPATLNGIVKPFSKERDKRRKRRNGTALPLILSHSMYVF